MLILYVYKKPEAQAWAAWCLELSGVPGFQPLTLLHSNRALKKPWLPLKPEHRSCEASVLISSNPFKIYILEGERESRQDGEWISQMWGQNLRAIPWLSEAGQRQNPGVPLGGATLCRGHTPLGRLTTALEERAGSQGSPRNLRPVLATSPWYLLPCSYPDKGANSQLMGIEAVLFRNWVGVISPSALSSHQSIKAGWVAVRMEASCQKARVLSLMVTDMGWKPEWGLDHGRPRAA